MAEGVYTEEQTPQPLNTYRFKVEVERTASGKERVMVRGYGDDLDEVAEEVMRKRDYLLDRLGLPE